MHAVPEPGSTAEHVWHVPPPSQPPAVAAAPLPAFITPAIDPRVRTAALALLASAAVLLLAALTKSWFVAGREGGVGLLGLEACRRGLCQSISWFDVPRIPSQIPILATTALLASLATVALLIHAGVVLLQGTPERVKLRWVAHSLGLAVIGTTSFVIVVSFGDWSRGVSLGWSTVAACAGLFAAGITLGFAVRPLTRA